MIIPRRNLTYMSLSGAITIPIEIATPEPHELGWCCVYTIGWPDEAFTSQGFGYDAIQAVLLTLQKIRTEIYSSEYHESGKLRWEREHSGYGFPVPRNERNLLIGEDIDAFG